MQKSDTLFSFVMGFGTQAVTTAQVLNPSDLKLVSLFVLKNVLAGLISLGITYLGHRFIYKNNQHGPK